VRRGAIAVVGLALLGGCGGDDDAETVTVIERERVVTETVPAPALTVPESETETGQPKVIGQLLLRAQEGENGVAIALVTEHDGERSLLVQARSLKPTGDGDAYEVWLFNSQDDAVSMGAQLTDRQGNYQGAGVLPDDYTNYEFIDVSRETVDQNAAHSGDSVLRGRLDDVEPAEPGSVPSHSRPASADRNRRAYSPPDVA
jgi:hypothetical protein